MASNIVFNGVTYSIPADGDNTWGPDLTAYFIAIASAALQKTGGTFTLTAEAAFGATYGLKSAYIKSYATNPAAAGAIRLGNTESVSWRNNANSADLALTSNASDALLFNSKNVLFSGLALIVNADVSASAAIAYSKLAALTVSRALVSDGSGVVSVATTTATEIGYVNGVTSAIQTQLNSKMNASFGIVSDVQSYTDQGSDPSAPSAGYLNVFSKAAGLFIRFAAGTVSRLLDSSIVTAKGDILAATASNTVARLGVGTDGYSLQADSGQASGIKWAAQAQPTLSVLTATSATKTPSGSDHYHSLTSNSVTLTAGTWRVDQMASFSNNGGSPAYVAKALGIFGSNGGDSASVPTLLSATGNLTVNSAYASTLYQERQSDTGDLTIINGPSLIITVTANVTIYIVTFSSQTTSANARVTAYMTAHRLY